MGDTCSFQRASSPDPFDPKRFTPADHALAAISKELRNLKLPQVWMVETNVSSRAIEIWGMRTRALMNFIARHSDVRFEINGHGGIHSLVGHSNIYEHVVSSHNNRARDVDVPSTIRQKEPEIVEDENWFETMKARDAANKLATKSFFATRRHSLESVLARHPEIVAIDLNMMHDGVCVVIDPEYEEPIDDLIAEMTEMCGDVKCSFSTSRGWFDYETVPIGVYSAAFAERDRVEREKFFTDSHKR